MSKPSPRLSESIGREGLIELAKRDPEAFVDLFLKLEARVCDLERRLAENSSNSSKPPSQDGAGKPPKSRSKSKRKSGGQTLTLERQVVDLQAELSGEVYRPGEYHYFRIHEPKERLVAAAPFRDRVVHHAIVRVIQPIFERRFIEDSYASRPGKGTHAAMRRASQFARRFDYALKCDVQKYFPSIDHSVLMPLVSRVIGDDRLLALITTVLVTHHDRVRQEWSSGGDLFDVRLHKCGLPIGNLTSQFFANVYLDALDQLTAR